MHALEVESPAAADITVRRSRKGTKTKCTIGVLGGLAAAALVVVALSAIGTTWCFTEGPCGPTRSVSNAASGDSPSEVIANEFAAELAGENNDDDTTRRLRRRRLAEGDATNVITLKSNTTVDVTSLVAAGRLNAEWGGWSFSEAVPAFIQGVAAHLKTNPTYTSFSAADRAEILEVTSRTMVRIQFKHELTKCGEWVDTLAIEIPHLMNKELIIESCKADNIVHYTRALTEAVANPVDDPIAIHRIVDLTNQAHPEAKGFVENVRNITSTLFAADAGFIRADDMVISVVGISTGAAAGFGHIITWLLSFIVEDYKQDKGEAPPFVPPIHRRPGIGASGELTFCLPLQIMTSPHELTHKKSCLPSLPSLLFSSSQG
jgi:hypothetical protein